MNDLDHTSSLTVRAYSPLDEQAWLRCRVLGFLDTAYFDDVLTKKPSYDGSSVELVADSAGGVVGLMDVAVEGELATIETVAVHPDNARQGVGSLLLSEVERRLPAAIKSLDAWTRDDEPANAWYETNGFRENYRYLHVYASEGETHAAIVEARPGLTPVTGFFQAEMSEELALRRDFRRVHVCRQYVRLLNAS